MTDIFSTYIYLIILSPALIFLILMMSGFCAVNLNRKFINFVILYVSGCNASILLYLYKIFENGQVYDDLFPLININNFVITFGVHIDRLGLIFAAVLFVVGFLVQLFSLSYINDNTKQYRFFALINLFSSFLAALFFSPNLFQTYAFWELAGVVSYLLIGFEYTNKIKSLASQKVFIINRIGDTSFLAGIVICAYYLYKYAPDLVSLQFSDINAISNLLSSNMSEAVLLTAGLLFIIAAVVKSALFPFYTWLQDAMEAELPVSALLHSATLVALGVYLCIRLYPFYLMNSALIKIIMLFGLITMYLCSLFACVQNHPKKVLAYSTSAQLGLMFFALGVLNIKAAVILFVSHALIKSMLFLSLPKNDDRWNFTKFLLFIIGGLSLSGVILSGASAKEILSCTSGDIGHVIIISAVSFLTAFYMLRITLLTAKNSGIDKSKNIFSENIAITAFLIANIVLYLYLKTTFKYHICAPLFAAVAGYMVVYFLYRYKLFFKIPYIYPLLYNALYIDKFYMTVVPDLYKKFSLLLSKFDDNILANYKPIICTTGGMVRFVNWIEINIMNKSVLIVADMARRISAVGRQIQTKNVQWYNFYGVIIVTAILSVLVIAYSAILAFIRGV